MIFLHRREGVVQDCCRRYTLSSRLVAACRSRGPSDRVEHPTRTRVFRSDHRAPVSPVLRLFQMPTLTEPLLTALRPRSRRATPRSAAGPQSRCQSRSDGCRGTLGAHAHRSPSQSHAARIRIGGRLSATGGRRRASEDHRSSTTSRQARRSIERGHVHGVTGDQSFATLPSSAP